MASIRVIAAVTNRTLVIGIINNNTSNSFFRTVTQNTAHINWRNTVCCRIMARCLNIAYIIRGSNTAIIGKAANAADIGIATDLACVIAAGNHCAGITAIAVSISTITLDDCKSLLISQHIIITVSYIRQVKFTDDATDISSL